LATASISSARRRSRAARTLRIASAWRTTKRGDASRHRRAPRRTDEIIPTRQAHSSLQRGVPEDRHADLQGQLAHAGSFPDCR
jgi:hypothetical protein